MHYDLYQSLNTQYRVQRGSWLLTYYCPITGMCRIIKIPLCVCDRCFGIPDSLWDLVYCTTKTFVKVLVLLCVTCVIKGDECIRGSALNAAEHTVEVGPPATPGLPPEICPLTAFD
jgi:hypothetical protein